MEISELIYRISLTKYVSNKLILKACHQFITSQNNVNLTLKYIKENLKNNKRESFMDKFWKPIEKKQDFITFFDPIYPDKLRQIYNPPAILYYAGDLNLLNQTAIAIIGARQCSHYTEQIIMGLVPVLVKNNLVTVSGLAYGADACCHQETLKYGGKTIAVIGNSIDFYYPKSNLNLQTRIAQNGLILSEYPAGTSPRRYFFPQRNRIISGVCDSVVVTEAKKRSGTLITAELALQENRNVWATPGRIDQSLSVGCNQLITEGARPYLSAFDLINEVITRY